MLNGQTVYCPFYFELYLLVPYYMYYYDKLQRINHFTMIFMLQGCEMLYL